MIKIGLPHTRLIRFAGLAALWLACGQPAMAQQLVQPSLPTWAASKVAAQHWPRIESGEVREFIVQFDDGDIQPEARESKLRRNLKFDDTEITARKVTRYKQLKDQVKAVMAPGEVEVVREYSHLPMSFIRVRDLASLQKLLRRKDVLAIHPDEKLELHLNESLPLIGQPAVAGIANYRGGGTAVAVLDTGVNYTHAAFGPCTAPGTPSASCKVIYAADIAPNDGSLDADGHGSNVAAISVGVASDTKIVALDVFNGTGASLSDILTGIDHVIDLKTLPPYYNIVAINLSLGSSAKPTAAQCSATTANPIYNPISEASGVGILTVISSGNSGWTDTIAWPACTPGAVSVGAVYDANVGGLSWGGSANCTDSTTAPDKITCFSNSAASLTMLAPGALIAAAGITYGGTSQAAPHVAGAVAALRGAYPDETLDQTQARMLNNGKSITDPRNGVVKPRLNLAASFSTGPGNDLFAQAAGLSGQSGQASGGTVNATKEVGEPNHAGDVGGKSVWYLWTAPASGLVNLDTHGSGFDTLLAVYTGTTVGGLSAIAANDDDGSPGYVSGLSFDASAGTTYRIAVDGWLGASGALVLNWAYYVPSSDLAVSLIAAPNPIQLGGNLVYAATVQNLGPDTAAGVNLQLTLPANAAFVSASSGCLHNNGVVDCVLGGLANNASIGIEVTVAPQSEGLLTATATATLSSGLDPVLGNEAVSASSQVVAPLPSGNDSGDVPIPPWALLLLGAGLYGLLLRRP
ncbi:MAG: S8 family serine peptidase [Hydrogenophilaceae bacterium]|nr:S8 family serine peptidase [Hydrogenophilaceae bacterium]